MFKKCRILKHLDSKFELMWQEFRTYKDSIPSFGAALLSKNLDKVVLVRAYNGNSWGFPKGKVNEGEDSFECACREVYEETSFDIKKHLEELNNDFDKENDWLEFYTKKGKKIKLAVIPDVSEKVDFKPNVRKEISEIKWFPIDKLPRNYNDKGVSTKFWQVGIFSVQLRAWIKQRKRDKFRNKKSKDTPIKILRKPQVKAVVERSTLKLKSRTAVDSQPTISKFKFSENETRVEILDSDKVMNILRNFLRRPLKIKT